AGLPDRGMHEDGGVQADHVGALLDEVPPPHPLDVVLELDAERAEVPAGAGAAVDLARLKHEAAALAQRDDHVHGSHARSPEVSCSLRTSRMNRPLRVGWPISRDRWVSSTARSSGPARPIGEATAPSPRRPRRRTKAATVAGATGTASAPKPEGRPSLRHVSHTSPPSPSAGRANGYSRPHSTQRSRRGRWPSTSRQRTPKQTATRAGRA